MVVTLEGKLRLIVLSICRAWIPFSSSATMMHVLRSFIQSLNYAFDHPPPVFTSNNTLLMMMNVI